MRKNDARLELRLSREDKIKIEKAAIKCGVSVKEYVLRCCKNKPLQMKPPPEFWELLNYLYTICEELDTEKRSKLTEAILKLQEAV